VDKLLRLFCGQLCGIHKAVGVIGYVRSGELLGSGVGDQAGGEDGEVKALLGLLAGERFLEVEDGIFFRASLILGTLPLTNLILGSASKSK
jgi:hypothetical protein